MKKNIKLGKIKFYLFLSTLFFGLIFSLNLNSASNLEGNFTEINVLDKISSKKTLVKLKNGKEI